MRKTIRYVRFSLMLTVAMLAAAVVSTLTIDVGWLLQHPAERYASDYLKRPVAIGLMRLHVFSGHFLMEDFSIGGLHDGDRPFLTAKRLSIALDWSTVFTQPATITIRSVSSPTGRCSSRSGRAATASRSSRAIGRSRPSPGRGRAA